MHKLFYTELDMFEYVLNLAATMHDELYFICSEVGLLSIVLCAKLLHLGQVADMGEANLWLYVILLHIW